MVKTFHAGPTIIIIIIIIKTLLSVTMYLFILQTNWGHLCVQLSINQIITY